MRSGLLICLALLPLVALGCAGTVKLDGDVDGFGPGTSGSYVVLDMDGDTVHFFLLSDQGGLCGKLRSGYEGALAAWETYQEDPTDAEQCNAYSEQLAEAWDPLVGNEANFLFTFVADGNFWDLLFGGSYDELTEPSDGTWDAADESHFQLTYFPKISPYQDLAERSDGCNFSEGREDADRAIDSYMANEGDLELEQSSSGGWRVDFEVDLDDEDSDFAASATGGFGAGLCEIEANTMPVAGILDLWTFGPWGL
jgi:hypothetical protein